jgi:hypothetical protein
MRVAQGHIFFACDMTYLVDYTDDALYEDEGF